MARFESFLPIILQGEGGYSNLIADLGGETYRGISRKWNPNWAGWKIIDQIKKVRTIKNREIINNQQLNLYVADLYKKEYWLPINGDKLIDQDVANVIGDHGVNEGVKDATEMVQWVLVNKFGKRAVEIDGDFGPITLGNLNSVNARQFFNEFTDFRVAFYKYRGNDLGRDKSLDTAFYSLGVRPNSKQGEEFLDGWLARMDKFIKKKAR